VLWLVGKVAVASQPLDLGGMIPVGLPVPVGAEVDRDWGAELGGDGAQDARGHGGRVWEKGPEEPHRDELEREAHPVVLAAPLPDQCAVAIIEMEEASQLGRRGLGGEAAVTLLLLVGQKLDWHPDSRSAGSPRPDPMWCTVSMMDTGSPPIRRHSGGIGYPA
jgi:hypothetical protein